MDLSSKATTREEEETGHCSAVVPWVQHLLTLLNHFFGTWFLLSKASVQILALCHLLPGFRTQPQRAIQQVLTQEWKDSDLNDLYN